jgi:hypothetical protein
LSAEHWSTHLVEYAVYSDGVIAVSLVAEDMERAEKNLVNLAIRWLPPVPCRDKAGKLVPITNVMGGETDWFWLPHTFGAAVGKKLVEQKAAGLEGFQADGFARMVAWLVDMEELDDAMCY